MPFASITDSSAAIIGATKLGFEKTWRPSRRLDLSLDVSKVSNQVKQVKAATLIAPTSIGNQGQAQPVKNLRITRTPISGGTQFRVSVSFTPVSGDAYFQGVAVSLQQADGTPLQVATGQVSPIRFTVPASGSASSVIVQSIGATSNTPVNRSPGRAISLRTVQS